MTQGASVWTQKMKTAPYKEPTDSHHDGLKSPEFHPYKSLKRFLMTTESGDHMWLVGRGRGLATMCGDSRLKLQH